MFEVGSTRQRLMCVPVCPCGLQIRRLELFHIRVLSFFLDWFSCSLQTPHQLKPQQNTELLTYLLDHEKSNLSRQYRIPCSCWCVYSQAYLMPSDSRCKSTSVQGAGLELVTNQRVGWEKTDLLRFDKIKSWKYSYNTRQRCRNRRQEIGLLNRRKQ